MVSVWRIEWNHKQGVKEEKGLKQEWFMQRQVFLLEGPQSYEMGLHIIFLIWYGPTMSIV